MKKLFICVMTSLCSTFAFAEGELVVNKVTIPVGGSQTMEVTIGSPTTFTAFQFDMKLPKGVSVTGASVTNPGAKRKVEIPAQVDATTNTWRFLSYDEENALLAEGTKLNVTLAADATAEAGQAVTGGIVLVAQNGEASYPEEGPSFDVTLGTNIKITSAKMKTFIGNKNLDFTNSDVRAYIVTGHDKATGKIWMSRVYDVPAGTPVLLISDKADTYTIPEVAEANSIYQNMLVGSLTGTTINQIDGDNTNYILSDGENGIGFYLAKASGSKISAGGAYLPVPTTIEAVGTAGGTESVPMNKYGMVCYYTDESLDLSGIDDLKAYTAIGYNKKGTIRLMRVKQVPAKTAVLLQAPEEKKNYSVPTVSLQQKHLDMFVGSLSATTINKEADGMINYYVSVVDNKVGFYLASESGTPMQAKRGWLPVPKSMTKFAATRGLVDFPAEMPIEIVDDVITMSLFGGTIGKNDGTTGIRSVDEVQSDDAWYNLKGQRIDTPTKKGLYIKNGKKVVVK